MRLSPLLWQRFIRVARALGIYERLATSTLLRRVKRRIADPVHPLLEAGAGATVSFSSPFVLMDIGTRGGIQPRWRSVMSRLEVVGFEPDPLECEALNEHFRLTGEKVCIYPVALGDADGERNFFVTGLPNSSGILPANAAFVARLSKENENSLRVVDRRALAMRTIDSFLAEHPSMKIDFLKIDVEGAECDVLAGAKRLLDSGAVLGVECEVWFGPIKNPESFARIDALLRASRLHLFDIAVRRYARRTFPDGFVPQPDEARRFGYGRASLERYGQPLTGDVVYLRDPVWELETGVPGFDWSDATVLTMALVFSIYDLPDCAIELVESYRKHFPSGLPFDAIRDALTPPGPDGERMRYPDYLELTARRARRNGGRA